MSSLERLSLSLEEPLLAQLQQVLERRGYTNRSEFIRDLIRRELVADEWADDVEVVATITMVYNHETRNLQKQLTSTQHHHHDQVLATTHLHLSESLCLEVIMARGMASEILHLRDHLQRQKGVLHVELSATATKVFEE